MELHYSFIHVIYYYQILIFKFDLRLTIFSKKFKMLKIHEINHYPTGLFMYQLDHRMLPYLFNELFVNLSPLHSYALRSIPKYKSSFPRYNALLHSITCSGPIMYSVIPATILFQPNLSSFRRMLKHFIINSPSFR